MAKEQDNMQISIFNLKKIPSISPKCRFILRDNSSSSAAGKSRYIGPPHVTFCNEFTLKTATKEDIHKKFQQHKVLITQMHS